MMVEVGISVEWIAGRRRATPSTEAVGELRGGRRSHGGALRVDTSHTYYS